jgi:acyl carrier protein
MRLEVEHAVRDEILRLLEEQGRPPIRVTSGDSLGDALGLTSLDVVELTVALTARLGVDPFRRRAFTEMQTVGDLVGAYTAARTGGEQDVELDASRRRAEPRRGRWGAQA